MTLKKEMIQNFSGAVAIVALGIFIYAGTLRSSYHFDDFNYIVGNPCIRNLTDFGCYWNNQDSQTRLITFETFALNYAINQLDVFGYHLVNLFIHIFNSLMVWYLAFQCLNLSGREDKKLDYGRKRTIALMLALFFLAHPIQTQAVSYISQRFASLACFFYLISIIAYIHARKHSSKISFVVCGVSVLMAMFTKETAFSIPIMLLLIEAIYFDKKIRFNIKTVAILGFLLIIPFLFSFNLSLVLFNQYESGSHQGDIITWANYFWTQFRVVVTYIRLILLPINQNLDYDYPVSSFTHIPTYFSLVFVISLILLAFKLRRNFPTITFGIFWFFIALSVESSFIPIRHVIFEHRLYLPLFGFAFSLFTMIAYLIKDIRVLRIFLSLIIILLSFLTIQRNKVWDNEISLWSDVVKKSSKKARGYQNLGQAYLNIGRDDLAIEYINKSLSINPNLHDAYNNRGIILYKNGDYQSALNEFNRAIEFLPGNAEYLHNRGMAKLQINDIQGAMADFDKAIKINPYLQKAHIAKAQIYESLQDWANAFVEYSLVIDRATGQLSMDFSIKDVLFARARLSVKFNHLEKALKDYEQLIKMDQNNLAAQLNRANVLRLLKRYYESVDAYGAVLRIEPNNFQAYNDRGNIYMLLGDYSSAINDYDRLIEIKPDLSIAYYNRALAWETVKDYTKAYEDMQKAVDRGFDVPKEILKNLKLKMVKNNDK